MEAATVGGGALDAGDATGARADVTVASVDAAERGDGTSGDAASGDGASGEVAPTWYEHVRPLMTARCVSCHRPGHVGPFSLETYADARPMARAIERAVTARTMPPWMPLEGCGRFHNDRSLRDAEIDTIVRWVRAGAPEGDAARAGPLPRAEVVPFRMDMRLGMSAPYTPDFSRSSTGADDYRCFVLSRAVERTLWITGYDLAPGVRAMVHHANVHAVPAASAAGLPVSPTGYSCFGGVGLANSRTIGVWVPGSPPAKYPENTAVEVAAGEALVVQMHYYRFMPGAAPVPPDQSSVLFELSPLRPARLATFAGPGPAGEFAVPARATGFRVGGTWTVPSRGTLWGVLPHMHKLGTRIQVRVGDTCAVDIPAWDFHWQQAFFFAQTGGIPVTAGTVTSITCEYDNPSSAPVRSGESSDEEMCGAPLYFTPE